MNNDLEQFSEEVLKFMVESDHAQTGDVAALARIALAAKQAKPDFYISTDTINDMSVVSTPAYRDLEDAEKRNLGLPLSPVYTTPQPANIEQSELLNKAHSLSKSIGELRKQIDSSGGYDFEALRSEQANSPVIPDGWKLVPIEPTQEMVDAHISGMESAGFSRAYLDMLRAAPKPESK